jgi:hypothetical protein
MIVVALLSGGFAATAIVPIATAQLVAPSDSLHVRLSTRLTAGRDASVRATTIAPLVREGRVVIPPGAILDGRIESSGVDGATRQHWLRVRFQRLSIPVSDGDTTRTPIDAGFVAIDNARESIDSAGRIVGPPMPSLIRSKRTWLLLALGSLHPVGAAATAAVLETEERERHRGIDLPRGAEGSVALASTIALPSFSTWSPPPAIAIDSGFVAALPTRSRVRAAGAAADVITLALIGTRAQVRSAFLAAGWDSSETVSLRTDFVTFATAARGEGYTHQPVSTNYLDGAPPAFVFQKLADTFVRRHHLRIWHSATTFNGDSLWLIAASRDVGVEFSTARRTFAHLTDPRIDDERDKVTNDLVAAGRVAGLSLIARAPISGASVNDGQTSIISDWRLAVLRLR